MVGGHLFFSGGGEHLGNPDPADLKNEGVQEPAEEVHAAAEAQAFAHLGGNARGSKPQGESPE